MSTVAKWCLSGALIALLALTVQPHSTAQSASAFPVMRTLQIYGGNVDTNWAIHRQEVPVSTYLRIYQVEVWLGASFGHRGDLSAALWIRRGATGVEELVQVRAWDHYDDTSRDGQSRNFTPFYMEAFPGDALVLTTTGSQLNQPVNATWENPYWKILGVAHIYYTLGG
jgi:hypothetical protein